MLETLSDLKSYCEQSLEQDIQNKVFPGDANNELNERVDD